MKKKFSLGVIVILFVIGGFFIGVDSISKLIIRAERQAVSNEKSEDSKSKDSLAKESKSNSEQKGSIVNESKDVQNDNSEETNNSKRQGKSEDSESKKSSGKNSIKNEEQPDTGGLDGKSPAEQANATKSDPLGDSIAVTPQKMVTGGPMADPEVGYEFLIRGKPTIEFLRTHTFDRFNGQKWRREPASPKQEQYKGQKIDPIGNSPNSKTSKLSIKAVGEINHNRIPIPDFPSQISAGTEAVYDPVRNVMIGTAEEEITIKYIDRRASWSYYMEQQVADNSKDYLVAPDQSDAVSKYLEEFENEIRYNYPDTYQKPFKKVILLRNKLLNDLYLSLRSKPPPEGTNLIDWILFEQKRGNSAEINTVLTILLRHLGIPARLVGGYRIEPQLKSQFVGIFPYAEHYRTEVLLKNAGWVSVDASGLDSLGTEAPTLETKLDISVEKSMIQPRKILDISGYLEIVGHDQIQAPNLALELISPDKNQPLTTSEALVYKGELDGKLSIPNIDEGTYQVKASLEKTLTELQNGWYKLESASDSTSVEVKLPTQVKPIVSWVSPNGTVSQGEKHNLILNIFDQEGNPVDIETASITQKTPDGRRVSHHKGSINRGTIEIKTEADLWSRGTHQLTLDIPGSLEVKATEEKIAIQSVAWWERLPEEALYLIIAIIILLLVLTLTLYYLQNKETLASKANSEEGSSELDRNRNEIKRLLTPINDHIHRKDVELQFQGLPKKAPPVLKPNENYTLKLSKSTAELDSDLDITFNGQHITSQVSTKDEVEAELEPDSDGEFKLQITSNSDEIIADLTIQVMSYRRYIGLMIEYIFSNGEIGLTYLQKHWTFARVRHWLDDQGMLVERQNDQAFEVLNKAVYGNEPIDSEEWMLFVNWMRIFLEEQPG